MRKEFLRNPIDFTRISSRFSTARKHPVLNSTVRAHKGTDYAAPTGTPIKAAGDGKIIFAGRKGGYGNTVILQHGAKYQTLYAHMSRFNRNTKTGRYVKQGQIIGYVGMTGLATGPHLHYEFRVNGVHRDHFKVDLPKAQNIASEYRSDFMERKQNVLNWLNSYNQQATQISTSDRKSTRLNSSHVRISYAVFCLKATATTAIAPLSLHDALPISTGPHLHYEFRVNGVHRDHFKVDLPKAQNIASEYRSDFMERKQNVLNWLNSYNQQATQISTSK